MNGCFFQQVLWQNLGCFLVLTLENAFSQRFHFKVARVIKLKLAFMEWFFHNLATPIKLYKIWYLNLDKALLLPRNQAIFVWKIENFDEL